MGFPSQFADSAVLRSGNHPFVYYILIGVACGVLTVRFRHLCPQSLGTRVAAIPDVEHNHLAGGGIHGDPYPLLMGFRLDKAGYLIGFHLQASNHHLLVACDRLGVSMIGQRLKAHDEKAQ